MRTAVAVVLTAFAGAAGLSGAGEPRATVTQPGEPSATTGNADIVPGGPAFDRLLSAWLADVVPTAHEDDSKWGVTERRVRGLTWDFDGGKVETRRRYGVVNHGLWKRWSVERRTSPPPADPSAGPASAPGGESLRVTLDEVRRDEDGRYAVTATVSADVTARGQVARWIDGVQWGSLSAEAELTLTATVRLSVAATVDWTTFPPAAEVVPTVVETRLALANWRVTRLSRLGRDVAEVVGDWLESAVRTWVEDQGPRVTEKLNTALAKRRDKLRWGGPSEPDGDE